jgi:alkaline phosphatase D
MLKSSRTFLLALLATFLVSGTIGCSLVGKSASPLQETSTASQRNVRPALARPQGLAILQGLTNANATQISVVVPLEKSLRFIFWDLTEKKPLTEIVELQHTIPGSTTGVRHFLVKKLKPGNSYQLRVMDSEGKEIDAREFRALEITKKAVKFAAASCMSDDYLENQSQMWTALRESRPDFLILLGDNNYAAIVDKVNKSPLPLSVLWERYAESALKLDLYHFRDLIPTVAIWDDFDYGMRDGGANHPYGRESKKAFEAYFAQNKTADFPEYEKGPGISAAWNSFGLSFLLLDNRSFRTDSTHFGKPQEDWVISRLKRTQNPAWLVSGDQWFGGYHRFESYEGNHKDSFKEFLSSLKDTKANVVFLSGDRHLSEIMKIEPELLGYETYEFTSSPMHAKTYPSEWDKIPNPRHWMGVAQQLNFNLFEVLEPQKGKRERQMKVRAIGLEGKTYYEAEVPLRK